MMVWIAIVVVTFVTGAVALTYTVGRINTDRVIADWEAASTPEGRAALDAVGREVGLSEILLNDAVRGAERARNSQDFNEAIRLVDLACWVLERGTPQRLDRLRSMVAVGRIAAASMLPLDPFPWRALRLRHLSIMGAVAAGLGELLVTTHERFQLRVRILGWGLRLSLRSAHRSAARIRMAPELQGAWDTMLASGADWKTLDREHLETFRRLVFSAAAEQRVAALAPHA